MMYSKILNKRTAALCVQEQAKKTVFRICEHPRGSVPYELAKARYYRLVNLYNKLNSLWGY
jgi:hypothetical protein